MTYLVAALLGVLQGLTEFLPISSTAHLLIAQRLLGYEDPGGVFTVMIQLGSILAVMWLYRAKIAAVIRGLPSQPEARRFAAMIVVAFLPLAAVGALYGNQLRQALYGDARIGSLIAGAFIVGGVVMLLVERWRPAPVIFDAEKTPLARALGLGVCQLMAVVPGVSRSGATIVGGMLMRLDRGAAAEFSFFLAMPTMTAAFAADLVDVWDQIAPARAWEITIGFVMAFLSALLVVRPFLLFVRRSGFAPFAWYRIAAGVVLLSAIAAGWE